MSFHQTLFSSCFFPGLASFQPPANKFATESKTLFNWLLCIFLCIQTWSRSGFHHGLLLIIFHWQKQSVGTVLTNLQMNITYCYCPELTFLLFDCIYSTNVVFQFMFKSIFFSNRIRECKISIHLWVNIQEANVGAWSCIWS